MEVKKICFLADSHSLYDDRIYWKEALSLKKAGYEIHYILAGDEDISGITEEGIYYQIIRKDYCSRNRYINFFAKRYLSQGLYKKMYKSAKALQADVYHIQDLKVNRIGRKLKNLIHQPKVIYDIHEPYPENIIDYHQTKGLGNMLKRLYSSHIRRWEHKLAKIYDLVIVTEENVQNRFTAFLPEDKVQIIYNYTNLLLPAQEVDLANKEFDAIYTGGITRLRGAFKILEAIKNLTHKKNDVKMLFLGSYFPIDLKEDMLDYIKENKLENNILLLDTIPYNEVSEYYMKSRIGLGIFLPVQTHQIILQIKLFEYMNFGLPIVGSNFGHIFKIIENDKVGLAVNPENPEEIAEALYKLLSDKKLYNSLSLNGRNAVKDKYRWELMEDKLISVYAKLLKENS